MKTRSSGRISRADDGEDLVVAVTGGAGFLGRHIVQQLKDSNEYHTVRVLDIRIPDVEHQEKGVEYRCCDLRKAEDVDRAIQGADVVIHTATAAPTGSNAYNHTLMQSVNVDGTQHVIDACVSNGVKALVYTSSASVVFDGNDLLLVDETTPYASKPLDFYTLTKIEGEKLVLDANGKGGFLKTCALRPSGIFGEYDQLTVPTIVSKAKAGKMKYIIGNGKNMMDWTYAGNVAQAHIQAARNLVESEHPAAAGNAYFITNNDPKPFWGMMGDICEGLEYGRPRIHLPFLLVMFLAYIVQYIVIPLMSPFKKLETDFTPFRITVASVNRTFSCRRANKDFGYIPQVDMAEALRRTLVHFAHLKNMPHS